MNPQVRRIRQMIIAAGYTVVCPVHEINVTSPSAVWGVQPNAPTSGLAGFCV